MSTQKRPVVLTIDDGEQNDVELRLQTAAEVIARAPDEVQLTDLRKADVILVDYEIEDWPGREQMQTIALKPGNGVALAAVLRSQLMEEDGAVGRRAFALHSGKLGELAGGLPSVSREHAIARTLNLEWVFSKESTDGVVPQRVQVAALAEAVKALPAKWPADAKTALRALRKRLALPPSGVLWSRRAADDVDSCNPPIHAWAVATEGMAVIRWLLHQVLPYPTFLWDERYLAARLHVTVASLREALPAKKAQQALSSVAYAGVLSDFLGQRWWRAGVEQLLWEWTDGQPFSADALSKAVRARISKKLVPLAFNRPVVCVDPESFRPTDKLVEVSQAVQVKPDDWPVYADQAWVATADVRQEGLTGFVAPQDRERAEASE